METIATTPTIPPPFSSEDLMLPKFQRPCAEGLSRGTVLNVTEDRSQETHAGSSWEGLKVSHSFCDSCLARRGLQLNLVRSLGLRV